MQQKHPVALRPRFLGTASMLLAVVVIVMLGLALRASFTASAGASPSPSTLPSAVLGTPSPQAVGSSVSAPPQATTTPAALPPLPDGLTNRTWVTLNLVEGVGYVAGTLDGRSHLVLPEGESPLAASDGRVLSVRFGPVAASGFATSSTLILRDVATGKVIVEAELPGMISYAVMDAETAYVAAAGTELPGEVPGVYALSLADGSVREVIAPQVIAVDPKGQAPWNAASRGPLALSPSGRTLASGVFLNDLCDIQTLDLGTGTLTEAVTGVSAAPWLLSDEVLVALGDVGTSGYDIATGKLLWVIEGARAQSGYLLDDLTLVEAYQDVGSSARIVATVDLRSGARRDLLNTPKEELNPILWAEASNDRYAVLIPGGQGLDVALAGTGSFLADLLDLSTGQVERAALRIGTR